ncbi:MAG: hypothetical protein JWO76_3048 [Nocardioides sp.]|nr:hypothetical protein [Nocardioides sp.]
MSAPTRVHDLLRAAPDGDLRVLHRGRHAVYVDLGGWCLGVVGADAAAVPCALRLRTPDLAEIHGASAYVGSGVLHLDGTPLVVGRIVDVRVARADLEGAARYTADSVTTQATPPASVAEFVGPLHLPARLDPAAVGRLVGLGDGLTPLGDDILCGWLATHRAAGVPTPDVDAAVRALMPRTTLLSATLLDCALHGEVLPEFAAYLSALGDRETAAARLAAVGHTSGAGLLYGARLALAALHHHEGIAA